MDRNDFREYDKSSIYHAWGKKGSISENHKYIKRLGSPGHYKYIYKEDLEKVKKNIAESGATASAKAGASVASKTLKKAFNSAKKVNTSRGIDRHINKAKKTVNDAKKWGEFAKNAKIEKAYVSKQKMKNVATGKTENVYMRDSKDNKKAKAVLNVRLKKDPKNLKKYEDQYKKLDSINEKAMGAQTKAIDAKAKAKKKVDKALKKTKKELNDFNEKRTRIRNINGTFYKGDKETLRDIEKSGIAGNTHYKKKNGSYGVSNNGKRLGFSNYDKDGWSVSYGSNNDTAHKYYKQMQKDAKKYEDNKIDPINKAKKKVDKALKKTKNSVVEKAKKSGHYQPNKEKPRMLSEKIEVSGEKTIYKVEGKTVNKKKYDDYQKKNAPKSNSKPEGKLGKSAIAYENSDGTVTYKIGNKKVSKSQYESYLKKKKKK